MNNDARNIQLGVDDTDHMALFCSQCGAVMTVTEVKTRPVVVDAASGRKDNCTWIFGVCPTHKSSGFRKFYWTTEDGEYCQNKTSL